MYRSPLVELLTQLFRQYQRRKNDQEVYEYDEEMKPKKVIKPVSKFSAFIIGLIFIIGLGIYYYVTLPAITTMSIYMWLSVIVILAIISMLIGNIHKSRHGSQGVVSKAFGSLAIIVAVVAIVGGIFSSPILSASRYAKLLSIEEQDFVTDIAETDNIKDIALMDSESAAVIGQRAVGSLSDVVSQFEVSNTYTQLDLKGSPMKVAPLKYAGFFKWFNNRKDGVPGYVIVDPLENEAKYVKLNKGMKYSQSGYFGDYLPRHIRFKYPTAVFEGYYFEIDEEGNPFYVCPVLKAHAGLFGARDVKGVVICDPCSGRCDYYDVKDIPNWVDHAYDGDLMLQKYRWKGLLSGGFINSVIGNKGCKQPTDDYGYRVIDGDVWMYTGVTSVNGDQSNIAFVLMNGRTGEAKYYPVVGCDETSAMEAAEGQVQHLGYTASFPALININSQPTYIMVLKDKSQLVKMYAMVNVQKYNIVATGTSQKAVLASYRQMMSEEGVVDKAEVVEKAEFTKKITVTDIQFITMDGDSYIYIKDQDRELYKEKVADDESVLFIEKGDKIEVSYDEGSKKIHALSSWK